MLPGELPNLFGRFHRGENAPKGVGLGLSICRGIVEAHGGSIAAFTNRKEGPSVSIFLPDCIAENGDRIMSSVLVIDYDEQIRRLLRGNSRGRT